MRKLVTWPWPRPFQGRFVTSRLGHATTNLPTKFEVSIFTRYGNMKGAANVENGVVRGKNACPESGISLPLQIWSQNHLLWTTSQLKGKLSGLYLRNETRYRQSVKCIDNYDGSARSCQNDMNFGPQTVSNSTAILPTLCKFCILLHCHGSQTEMSKQNSTKLCQVMGSKSP